MANAQLCPITQNRIDFQILWCRKTCQAGKNSNILVYTCNIYDNVFHFCLLFIYCTETKKLLQKKNHNISWVSFRVLIHFYGQTEFFFKYLSICGPRKPITSNGRIISQHPACFECLASGENQNINIFNQIWRFLSVTQHRVKNYPFSSCPLFQLFYYKNTLFHKLALFSFTGRWDKNKFLSCLATRRFISGPNRSSLFCPPEKVHRASVQNTVLSILKIWMMSLQYNHVSVQVSTDYHVKVLQ